MCGSDYTEISPALDHERSDAPIDGQPLEVPNICCRGRERILIETRLTWLNTLTSNIVCAMAPATSKPRNTRIATCPNSTTASTGATS